MAADAVSLTPDYCVIYMGHNDWMGSRLNGAFVDHPARVRLRTLLSGSRLFLFGRQWILRAQGKGDGLSVSPSGGPATAEEMEKIVGRFEKNLETITRIFLDAGSPVLLSTVISNPFYPPDGCPLPDRYLREFHGKPRPTTESELPMLLEHLDGLPGTEDLPFQARAFHLGLRAWREGRLGDAFEQFGRARDADPVLNRAVGAINEAIRRVARRDCFFLDLEDAFRARFTAGESVGGLFDDNLHFSKDGTAWVARQIVESMERIRWLPESSQ